MTVSLRCNVDEGLVDLLQLRERFAGSDEVRGSIPLDSTIVTNQNPPLIWRVLIFMQSFRWQTRWSQIIPYSRGLKDELVLSIGLEHVLIHHCVFHNEPNIGYIRQNSQILNRITPDNEQIRKRAFLQNPDFALRIGILIGG
ncbi:MAG: hypothetical protein K0R28_3359 [Paenibacillus sp.]|nr:hypothetical protein [Paenibacillus sp.]